MRSLMLDADRAIDEWFQRDQIERLWTEQKNGARDNGLKLFGLVCFALWLHGT